MNVGTIHKLLDRLEELIVTGIPVPFTPWIILNQHKIAEIADKTRAAIPGEIQEARNVLRDRDEIQADAARKANQMLTDAKQRAEMMLSESELLKAVKCEAEKIRKQVIAECEMLKKQAYEEAEMIKTNSINESISIREGADRYADNILANLDRDLTELHHIIKNGQKHLAKAKNESIATITSQRASISSKNSNSNQVNNNHVNNNQVNNQELAAGHKN